MRRQLKRRGGGRGGAGACSVDPEAIGKALVMDPTGGQGGDRRGVGGGPDDGRRGDNDAGVEAIEEQAYEWWGNDSNQG
jgi:hypothetical protein